MPFAVLKNWHPMAGCDFHIPWLIGTPSPAPAPGPYFTVQLLMGLGFQCDKADDHKSCNWGLSMLKGTDIGTMIGHVGTPSYTLPVEILASGSKSHFGTTRYKSKGKAVAAALLVIANPNLNCGTPMPTLSGVVFAPTTHFVDMSMGDVAAGFAAVMIDMTIQAALNLLGGKIGDMGGALFKQMFGSTFALNCALLASEAGASRLVGLLARGSTEAAGSIGGALVGTVVGFFFGGPMGADIGTFGGYGKDRYGDPYTPGGTGTKIISNAADDAIHRSLDDLQVYEPAQPLPGSSGTGV